LADRDQAAQPAWIQRRRVQRGSGANVGRDHARAGEFECVGDPNQELAHGLW
jgi:hypothetical protein